MTERHELCHPASLICEDEDVARRMTKDMEANAGNPEDIEEAEKKATEEVVQEREEALAAQLAAQRRKKSRLVDPLQYAMSIEALDLANYRPIFGPEAQAPSQDQKDSLEKLGIKADSVETSGQAEKLLNTINDRRARGLATPKQIKQLENRGFQNVGTWSFEQARRLIDRIAANGWRTPKELNPRTYTPPADMPQASGFW